MNQEKLIQKEYKKAIQQVKKLVMEKKGAPSWASLTANQAGQKLAKHFKVNRNLILLGTSLMDIELSKAMKLNQIEKHVQMSYETAKKFLNKFKLPIADKKKILDGVKYHHGTKKFPSLEAEIIMNADCYKFLLLDNIKKYLKLLAKRGLNKKDAIKQAKYKFNEKSKALSLDYCLQELTPEIKKIKNYFKKL